MKESEKRRIRNFNNGWRNYPKHQSITSTLATMNLINHRNPKRADKQLLGVTARTEDVACQHRLVSTWTHFHMGYPAQVYFMLHGSYYKLN